MIHMTVMRLFIDTWAWIEYFNASDAGKKVAAYIENADTLLTSSLNIAEVVSKYRRKGKDPTTAVSAVLCLAKVIFIDAETAVAAGELHAEIKPKQRDLGMVDAFVAVLARHHKAKILTGDTHFRMFPEAIIIT